MHLISQVKFNAISSTLTYAHVILSPPGTTTIIIHTDEASQFLRPDNTFNPSFFLLCLTLILFVLLLPTIAEFIPFPRLSLPCSLPTSTWLTFCKLLGIPTLLRSAEALMQLCFGVERRTKL